MGEKNGYNEYSQLKTKAAALKNRLYTIGYSPFSVAGFIDMLRQHGLTAVCDVRSMPYSRYRPEFNKDMLEQCLFSCGMEYFFFGNMLGGRPADPELYEGGKVLFDRVALSSGFGHGLAGLRKIAGERVAVLMCAEKDPLTCHRTILVCRHLRHEFDIFHILEDGSLEANGDAERRLVKLLNIPADDLFRTEEELIHDAYELQGKRIAYRKKE